MRPEPRVSADKSARRSAGAAGRNRTLLRSRRAALAGLYLLGCLFAAGASAAPSGAAPHAHFRMPNACPRCHVFVEKILSPDRFTSESDDFCLECHRRESLGRSHPRGTVAPRATPPLKVPEPFRLSSDGRLMCLTCHAAHGPYLSATPSFPGQGRYDESATGGGSGYKTYYLRRVGPGEGFAALCHACHGELR